VNSKKPARSYYSESDTKDEESDEEEEEEESDFDTDVEISKYNKKIEKRTQSLSSIEKQIQQLKQSNNPYAKHSVF
jgi:TATA-binding protein-associated factor Taf7